MALTSESVNASESGSGALAWAGTTPSFSHGSGTGSNGKGPTLLPKAGRRLRTATEGTPCKVSLSFSHGTGTGSNDRGPTVLPKEGRRLRIATEGSRSKVSLSGETSPSISHVAALDLGGLRDGALHTFTYSLDMAAACARRPSKRSMSRNSSKASTVSTNAVQNSTQRMEAVLRRPGYKKAISPMTQPAPRKHSLNGRPSCLTG
mmetsp:Transcript_63463/g.166622  ORF Transcript_63463/g.166622 Transcript_63463/m.166622 type:complete len:205 (+) Transcript_63463:128-742(+)